jgi:WD40 repeat protein
VNAVAISDNLVISCSDDRTVRIWNSDTGRCVKVLAGHSARVRAVAVKGDFIASSSDDMTVRVWNRNTGDCLQTFETIERVSAVEVSDDLLVTGSEDGEVRTWDIKAGLGHHQKSFRGHNASVISIRIYRRINGLSHPQANRKPPRSGMLRLERSSTSEHGIGAVSCRTIPLSPG